MGIGLHDSKSKEIVLYRQQSKPDLQHGVFPGVHTGENPVSFDEYPLYIYLTVGGL